MRKPLTFLIVWCLLSTVAIAQDTTELVLPWKTYMRHVYQHHPVAQQLRLAPTLAEAELMTARGGFDPKIKSNYRNKDYKETEYYSLWDTKVEVPVWNFADLKAGYENNRGYYLNPEATVPETGLWYAGVSVPIGRGLFIDSRRAAVQQALLQLEGTEADRQKNMNKFLLQATKAYWEWTAAHLQFELQKEAVELARFRLRGTKQRVIQGDAAAVDTLEANLQLQSRLLDFQQAQLDLTTAELLIATYLWDDTGNPLQLREGVEPETTPTMSTLPRPTGLDTLLSLIPAHPELRKLIVKSDQLDVDRRLALENLKPELSLEYNWLWTSGTSLGEVLPAWDQDYKWGGTFAIPIFLRKERGKLQQVRVKSAQIDLEVDYLEQSLTNQLRQQHTQWLQYRQMQSQARDMASQYAQLLAAERQRFQTGESSLFLVNSREIKYLEARSKVIDLQAKEGKALAELWDRSGVLEVLWQDVVE